MTRTFSAHGPSVPQLEAAVHRVEWLRKLSEQVGQSEHPPGDWTRDSAAAVEEICLRRAEARRKAAAPGWQQAATRAESQADPLGTLEATARDPNAHPPSLAGRWKRWFGRAG